MYKYSTITPLLSPHQQQLGILAMRNNRPATHIHQRENNYLTAKN